jgi:predicted acyltransferase
MSQKAARFLALDVLRGMTVCFMIIVNTGGTGAEPFAPLLHASWHGFTPTDLVFPSFLFAVGNAMAFSMNKFEGAPASEVIRKIVKRGAIIFLLGFLMYWFPFVHHTEQGYAFNPLSETRIFGVLQRIGICYIIAGLMIHFLSRKMVWLISAGFLLGYWALMYAFGDYTLLNNFARTVDLALLGENHLYNGEGVRFDPEGILSTFPAVVNVVIGYLAGAFIREKGNQYETIAKLALAGAAMVTIAYFWDQTFPINKKLWTSSFVIYTCGIDLVLLAALIYIIDILGWKSRTGFFEVFGKNPLIIYLLSELMAIMMWFIQVNKKPLYMVINDVVYQKILPGPWGSLAFALTVMFTCWLVGWWMDKRKIYIRV